MMTSETPDKDQNMRTLSADKNRSQLLIGTSSGLPLINEHPESHQKPKESSGTPQTKQGTTLQREDSNTQRGSGQSGMKMSRQTNTLGNGSSDDR